MIKNIAVITGANYGDEGKGLGTYQFCESFIKKGLNPLVICHNGGAQRGHTVIHERTRHVFRHVGSGSFLDCPTYLSEDFILNPIIFREEYEQLLEMGIELDNKVFVSEKCLVTTPYEMFLNDMKERKRNKLKHGSCGLGIFETIQRNKEVNFAIGDLYISTTKFGIMSKINEYFNKRVEEENLFEYKKDYMNNTMLLKIISAYFEDLEFMYSKIQIINSDDEKDFLERYDSLVFEGAQGLLLDQNNKEGFPHLTPSNTGADNPIKILSNLDLTNLDWIEVCYITRTYLTRHGAGHLENECSKDEVNSIMYDKTNVPNEYQDTLRYGLLDIENLIKRVNKDFKKYESLNCNDKVFKTYLMTHMNEYGINPFKILEKDSDIEEIHMSFDENLQVI